MAYRQSTVTFMRQHRDDFEPYMEDEEDFDRYCSRMSLVWLSESNSCECAWSHHAITGCCDVLLMEVCMHKNLCCASCSLQLHCRMARGQAIRSRWLWLVIMES